MKLKQLSVFLENKPGQLTMPARVLADAGINILTLCLADTQQFGILRLIIKEWEAARKVLEAAGCVVNATDVVAIEVTDKPGGLAHVLEIVEAGKMNIEYMYAFTFGRSGKAVLIFCFDDPDAAVQVLQSKGINVIGSADLFAGV
jgi:hypothetical protein